MSGPGANWRALVSKVAALRTARHFAERKGRVDWAAFDRLMARSGGEPPRAGDELPPPAEERS